jgi:hypothetical protein
MPRKKCRRIKQHSILGNNATLFFWEVFLKVSALKVGVRIPTYMPLFSLIIKRHLNLHGRTLDRVEEARVDCGVIKDSIASPVDDKHVNQTSFCSS